MKKSVNGIKQGQIEIIYNGFKIKTMLYKDLSSLFIMVKSKKVEVERINKTECIVKSVTN